MLHIRDSIAGETIRFHYVENHSDLYEVADFIKSNSALGVDTESTGINCYRPGWKLRTFQIANAYDSFVVPARCYNFISWAMRQEVNWIGHNLPHDIRAIDHWLGYETGVQGADTYIPAHYLDPRKIEDGGTGHGLKELSIAHIDREAGKWERALKAEFKNIRIPMEGLLYKSGPNKGKPRFRKATLSEGWSLIDPRNPYYVAYAAADPLLTYRLWRFLQPYVRRHYRKYKFDQRIQWLADRLHRRAIPLDVAYTKRLSQAYARKIADFKERAAEYGCANVQSGKQIAETLMRLGVSLTERTKTGQFKTDDGVLRGLLEATDPYTPNVAKDFIHCVLGAKQIQKRRESYTESMLAEMDSAGRIHPSINTLGARTTRMSVSGPPLQQLPTKDREADE